MRRGLDEVFELGLPAETAARAADLLRRSGGEAELIALLHSSPVLHFLLIRYASCSFHSFRDTPVDEISAWRMLGGRRLRPYFSAVLQVLPDQPELPHSASWRKRMQEAGEAVLQVCSSGRNDLARSLLRMLELVPMYWEQTNRALPPWQKWGSCLLPLLQEHLRATNPLVSQCKCLQDPQECSISEEHRRQAAIVHISLALAEQGLRQIPGAVGSRELACHPEVWSILDLSPWRLQNLLEESHV